MRSKLAYLVVATIWLASATAMSAQVPVNDVHVRLVLAENRTTFRIGEPIMLVLEFTADRGGYKPTPSPTVSKPAATRFPYHRIPELPIGLRNSWADVEDFA